MKIESNQQWCGKENNSEWTQLIKYSKYYEEFFANLQCGNFYKQTFWERFSKCLDPIQENKIKFLFKFSGLKLKIKVLWLKKFHKYSKYS